MLWDDPEGRDGSGYEMEGQEGGDICILMADLHCYMAETNTTSKQYYIPFFFFFNMRSVKRNTIRSELFRNDCSRVTH